MYLSGRKALAAPAIPVAFPFDGIAIGTVVNEAGVVYFKYNV